MKPVHEGLFWQAQLAVLHAVLQMQNQLNLSIEVTRPAQQQHTRNAKDH